LRPLFILGGLSNIDDFKVLGDIGTGDLLMIVIFLFTF
jgi:hypothetical protein